MLSALARLKQSFSFQSVWNKMITTNVLQRVFRIRIGKATGTVFAIDHRGRQYLITARHLLAKNSDPGIVEIFHDATWKPVQISIVGMCSGDPDIAVLAANIQLAPTHPLKPTAANLIVSQQVFFLGFPLGLSAAGSEINRDFPMPLVKSGILSGMEGKPLTRLWVDGHNNPGFSGGPLVFKPAKNQPDSSPDYRVAGVISGYRISHLPVYDSQGHQIGLVPENSGIVEAYSIKFAIDLIDRHPIGFALNPA